MKRRVLLRADGSRKIGFGHLYRVLALAEMLKAKCQCILVTSSLDDPLAAEAKRHGISIINVEAFDYSFPNEKSSSEEIPFDMNTIIEKNDTVVIDGYWFGVKYQSAIKAKGCRLVCIDDLALGEFRADVIINHAPGVEAFQYKVGSQTKLCLGLDYLILRPSFFESRAQRRKQSKAIYLSFGGSDYYGLSFKFLNLTLTMSKEAEIHLLLSSSFSNDLIKKLSKLQDANVERVYLHENLNGQEISDLIDKCTHAITSSSTVALEVVARGIKPLIGYYSGNQKNIYDGLVKSGFALGIGNLLDNTDFHLKDYLDLNVSLDKLFNNGKLLAIFEPNLER
jgi:UDP-2,4-diacetamido-2,4,6-trideoxy-beta-L-altropyranose hydrolase